MDKDFLDHYSERVVEMFAELEDQILYNAARKLKRHASLLDKDNPDVASWYTKMLNELPALNTENVKYIAKHAGMTRREVTKALKEAGLSVILETDNTIGTTGLLEDGESLITRSMDAFIGELDKFNVMYSTMISQMDESYRHMLTTITAKAATGTISGIEAQRLAISALAQAGVPALIDKRGARWSPEAYANLVVRQTINSAANRAQDERLAQHGVELVIISHHLGARPKCAPYQNKVYSINGTIHPKYPPIESTSMGLPDGLFGINCGHYKIPFIDGVSVIPDDYQTDKENAEHYEMTQKQRELERRIRRAKREENMMKMAGDIDGAKAANHKVRVQQANMRQFINDNPELTRRYNREQITGRGFNAPPRGASPTPTPRPPKPTPPKPMPKPTPPLQVQQARSELSATVQSVKKYGNLPISDRLQTKIRAKEKSIMLKPTEVGIMYNSNGDKLWEQSGGRDYVDLQDAIYKGIIEKGVSKDVVLTHNHPLGSSFSTDDLQMLVKYRMTEIRAVGSNNILYRAAYTPSDRNDIQIMSAIEDSYEKHKSRIKDDIMRRIKGGTLDSRFYRSNGAIDQDDLWAWHSDMTIRGLVSDIPEITYERIEDYGRD